MPPKPSLSSLDSSQTSALRPVSSASATACSASQLGLLRFAGTVASTRARQPAPPTATARRSIASVASSVRLSPITTWAAGCLRGPLERQWKPKEPSIVPTTKGSSPSAPVTLGIVVATPCRSKVWRPSAAPARRRSIGRASPTPTRSTTARSGLSGLPPGTSTVVTSPVRPVAFAISHAPSRSSPVRSLSASAPGPRRTPSSPGSTGSATTSTPLRACGSAPLKANWGGDTWGGSVGVEVPDESATGVSRRRP